MYMAFMTTKINNFFTDSDLVFDYFHHQIQSKNDSKKLMDKKLKCLDKVLLMIIGYSSNCYLESIIE